jgi:hypothetical protein
VCVVNNFIFGTFALISFRQRDWFFRAPAPSRALAYVSYGTSVALFLVAVFGIPGSVGIAAIDGPSVCYTFVFAFLVSLLLNDALKVLTIRLVGVKGVDY